MTDMPQAPTFNPAAETMKVEYDRDQRVSLSPLTPEQALRGLLRTPPLDKA